MKIVLRHSRSWPILLNISTTTEPVFTSVLALVDVCMQIIKRTKVSQQTKGCCYGKQLIFGDFCRRQN